jgi:hypothetical protein
MWRTTSLTGPNTNSVNDTTSVHETALIAADELVALDKATRHWMKAAAIPADADTT